MNPIRAIIADDEKQLRLYLKARLDALWPDLVICCEAENGLEALELIERHHPDIAFLDIKMPGLSGIEVAQKIATKCRVVFITAYEHFAIKAFENQALDYLLKPVTDKRLGKTIKRLRKELETSLEPSLETAGIIKRLVAEIKIGEQADYLRWIKVQHGDGIRLIPVDDVYYFQASEKYTMVITKEGEFLIRKSIRELSDKLDPDRFWRIHRGTIVNADFIAKTSRSFSGRCLIKLKDRPEILSVSRSYAYLFKQM